MAGEVVGPKSELVRTLMDELWGRVAQLSQLQDDIDGDLVEMAELFYEISECKAELGAVHYRFSRRLANAMDSNEAVFEGVGTLKRWRGKKRKNWENDRLVENIRARARDEIECDDDGVVVVDEAEAFARALARCARFEWRVTGLSDMGIDVDHFCDVEESPATVSFKPADK